MPKYEHVFEIAFAVPSMRRDAEDVTPAMLRGALLRRLADLMQDDTQLDLACSLFDTSRKEDV